MDTSYEGSRSADEAWAKVKPFVQEHKLNYPVLMGDATLITSYKLGSVPSTYLIDKQGRIAATYSGAHADPSSKLHPVQQAWIDEQAPQCGSCQNGWMMYSAHLLATVRKPTESQIRAALSGLKCRCGSQVAILRAVRRAARTMGEA